MENLDKKFKQRVRMIKYFIDATIEITKKKDMKELRLER